jgi:dTDP-4-dehydrorhamnose 3,5-epimerase
VRIHETDIAGAFLLEPVRIEDARGFFARTWCARELEEYGLNAHVAQMSMSYNAHRGTIRGMHWQAAPHEEAKIARCTCGSVFDVIVDIRPESSTFMRWSAFTLSRENRAMLYIPEGVAHGFQTLEDETELTYQMSVEYRPEAARGIAWNDPAFAIPWPISDPILSPKDRNYERFACFTFA